MALAVAVIAAVPAGLPAADWIHRLGIDLMLPLARLVPDGRPAVAAPIYVVAITEGAYGAPALAGAPQVAWTPHLAKVLSALDGAGARVVGLDLVYPTTLDQPGLVPGYDRPLLHALRALAGRGALVMGMVRLSSRSIEPERRQQMAAGGGGNIRPLNLLMDEDEVVRRYPAAFDSTDGTMIPSFGAELAARAGAAVPSAAFVLDFRPPPGALRTVSFAALHACAEAGDAAAFERFRNTVVLVGTELDVEDRFVAANRLAVAPSRVEGCDGAPAAGEPEAIVSRRSISGVHVHAAAVQTLLAASAPAVLAGPAAAVAVGLWAFTAALVFFRLRPARGLAGLGAGTGALAAGGIGLFVAEGIVLPAITMTVAALGAFALIYAFRFVTEDRVRRRISHAFKHYLAPALVDRLAEGGDALRLGGDRRRVTLFFSDIAGFTALSEHLADDPERLVEVINGYLACMTEVIQNHGGYVDKYIGDAIMAVWGAPLPDPAAEENAVRCALACLAALDRFNEDFVVARHGLPPIGTRIGINSGDAVVGNMGGATRLNYTVIGDAVNLAARLEGANKTFGSRLMIGEETAARLPQDIVLRRLDRLVVKGKTRPVAVLEPFGEAKSLPAGRLALADAFHAALELYEARQFDQALARFEVLAGGDPAAAVYVERCRRFIAHPPAADWDGTFTMTSK
ncbi:adenylate/guanylate cyclase domain-containing protein [Caenispirillum bisanense]|uniref:adenylate/guanylate cyclase domain-containing protein n=1 Tax=Caenispirillum bisanense TaxID=414052 RepID=UPI0031E328EF